MKTKILGFLGIIIAVAVASTLFVSQPEVAVMIEGSSGKMQYKGAEVPKYSYSPSILKIKPGTKVTWTNVDSVTDHTVTSDSGFDSGLIRPRGKFSFAFQKAGSYKYFCSLHPWVSGELSVTD